MCTENTLKAFKRIRRKRQEGLSVNGEYADGHNTEPISATFRPKQKKFQILNHLCRHDGMGKKNISRYCPFKYFYTFHSLNHERKTSGKSLLKGDIVADILCMRSSMASSRWRKPEARCQYKIKNFTSSTPQACARAKSSEPSIGPPLALSS